MLKKLLFGFSILFIYSITFSNYNYKASINNVELIPDLNNTLDLEVIELERNIDFKYLLSDSAFFKIEGRNFIGYNIEGTLKVIFGNEEYEPDTYNKNDSENTIYFSVTKIRDLIFASDAREIQFKFCPSSSENGKGRCTYSKTFKIYESKTPYNDPLAGLQYYLDDLNINSVKKNLENNFTPTVAIIDDGISILHQDLRERYWYNTNEIQGNNIDDDNNGYIDDYYGWNFDDDSTIMLPKGNHGTNVASIIGAVSNNNIGISGILDDVNLMPLIACSESGCSGEAISNSIIYAANNGADIINLSLGYQWFNYNADNSDAIKYANDKGSIVVISLGNGDTYLTQNGVDTTYNKISPVCNEEKESDIIGVSALSIFSDKMENGLRTSWTNYGSCSDIYTYGEGIIVTNADQTHAKLDGTSFSAPIISGVVGLGFTKYGKQDKEIVYKSLVESKNQLHGIDAEKYIENLGKNIELYKESSIEKEVENKEVENIAIENDNKYINIFRKKLGDKLYKIPTKTLNKLITQIDNYLERDLSDDLILKLEALRILIEEVLSAQ